MKPNGHEDHQAQRLDQGTESVDATNEVDETMAGISGWGVSLVVHAAALLVMFFVVFYVAVRDDPPPIRVGELPEMQEPEDPPPRDPVTVEVTIEAEEIIDDAQVVELDLQITEFSVEEPEEAEQPMKGQKDADALLVMGGTGAFMAIGANSGASSCFGPRTGGAKRIAIGSNGGSQGALDAVRSALIWFVRHQSPNGQWDVDGYPVNCEESGPKCEPGTAHTGLDGDVACTGYALLCFLGAGYDHVTPSQFQFVVDRGIDWLLRTQDAGGVFGRRNYEHPVATMALAEAYAMTNDPELREATQRGVDVILARQAPDAADAAYGLGWDYLEANPRRLDSSVSGWNVMALKSAKVAGLDIGNGLAGAGRWLEGAWRATNADLGVAVDELDPYGVSRFPYTWDSTTGAVKHHDGDLTCVGTLCAVFLGRRSGDSLLETTGNWCFENQTPAAWPTDTYYLYYNTLSMFQLGGERWQTWNGQVRDLLVDNQRDDDGCFEGSWDPQGAGGHKVAEVGRLLVTAYCALSLEVYYRYGLQFR